MPSKIFKEPSSNENNENNLLDPFVDNNQTEEHTLALPRGNSESRQNIDEIMIADGYLKNKSVKILKRGSKVKTDFNINEVHGNEDDSKEEYEEEESGIHKQTTSSLRDLRSKIGFSWQSFVRKFAFVALFGVVILLVLSSVLAAFAIDKWNSIKPIDDRLNQRRESSVVYARDGKTKIFEFYNEERREFVSIKDIPESMQLAIIALEDENFYYNDDGIPWKNIVGAASKCILSVGDECRGGSGLSQQLVKIVTEKQNQRNFDTKVDELFTAIKLNGSKNKSDILELYLNWVPFGRNAYGVQSASKIYFGKDVRNINVVESCYLAALPQKPGTFSASIGKLDTDNWKDYEFRKNSCLEKLRSKNLLGDGKPVFISSDQELATFKSQTAILATNTDEATNLRKQGKIAFIPNRINDEFPHFREYVTTELAKFVKETDLYTKGYQIITTIDPQKQRDIEKIYKDSEKTSVIDQGANNAAGVVLDGPTGEIISMVGSLGYDREDIDGQVNIMTSPRQPGSSIKPYVYANAMAKGFNPSTIVIDTPTNFSVSGADYTPLNFNRRTQGPMTMRFALQNSLNIPTVKAACMGTGGGDLNCSAGMNEVFNFTEKTGLKFACYPPIDGKDVCNDPKLASQAYKKRCGLASVLGGCEVIGLSHATGINTILQEGYRHTATPFISIKDNTGKELYTPESKQLVYPDVLNAIDPLIARQMTNVLSDYESRRAIFGASAKSLELSECKVAAKTGTTNDVKDTWTVGGCSNYTNVVWIGNTDNRPMKGDATSANAAAPLWNKVMKYLETGQKPKPFVTDGLISIAIEPSSGFQNRNGPNEWVTPAQKKILDDTKAKMANPDYIASTKNIFENRTALLSQEIQINKLDGKLATAQTLPENIEKKVCIQLLPEFPLSKNWADPVNAIAGDKYCKPPTEKSTQDQVAEQSKPPIITSNLDSNKSNISVINLKANTQGASGKIITKVEILVDGSSVKSATNNDTLDFNTSGLSTGPHTVTLRATDNFGATFSKDYSDVTFGSTSTITTAEISSLTVICPLIVSKKSAMTCSFSLPSNKTLPSNFKLGVETSVPDGICSANGQIVSCSNVPTGTTTGVSKIFGQIGNETLVDTGETVTVF